MSEFVIRITKSQDLEVFNNDKKVFYTKTNWSWSKSNIKIFNEYDEEIIDVEYSSKLFKDFYKIIYQSEKLNLKINSLERDKIILSDNSIITREELLLTFKSKKIYHYKGKKIATSEEKLWFWNRKHNIKFDELNTELSRILTIITLVFERYAD